MVEKVQDQVVNNPKIDREVRLKVEQALKESISLQKVGHELAGRDRPQQALPKSGSRAKTNRKSSTSTTNSSCDFSGATLQVKSLKM